MYFPYLNNKQAESRAISDLTINKKLNNVIPIISTSFIDRDVDWTSNPAVDAYILKRFKLVKTLVTYNQKFILLFDDSLSFGRLSIEYIHNCLISGYQLNTLLFDSLCTYGINDTDLNLIGNNHFCMNRDMAIFYHIKPQIYSTFSVKYNILVNQNFILDFIQISLGYKVAIMNSFIAQSANKHYPTLDIFQTYGLNYVTHGLNAFGDFTILNPDSSSGGGANANHITVAIHMTFLNQNTINIAHYLCEPYEEAGISKRVECALNRLRNDSQKFENTLGLGNLLALKTTNLVKLKEHSISHHIEFMSKY